MTMKVLLFLITNTITVAATTTWTGVQATTPALSGGVEVAWGDTGGTGTFVAVGQFETNNLFYSDDAAVTWQAATTTVSWKLASVCWGLDKFVAVQHTCASVLACVITSADGITWATRSFGTGPTETSGDKNWYYVRYGGGHFVAAMHRYRSNEPKPIQYSADGITWTSVAVPATNDILLAGLAYGAGKWVAIGHVHNNANAPKDAGKTMMTSTDNGASWTYQDTPANGGYGSMGVHFANNLFVWANGQKIYSSVDGLAWTERFSGDTSDVWMSVGYGAGTWIVTNYAYGQLTGASTGTDRALTSTDAVTWTRGCTPSQTETTAQWHAKGIAFGDNKFVVPEMNFAGCTSNCITVFKADATSCHGSSGSPTPTHNIKGELILQGISSTQFDSATKSSLEQEIANLAGSICGLSGTTACTESDVECKACEAQSRRNSCPFATNAEIVYTLAVYSAAKGDVGISRLSATTTGLQSSSFLAAFQAAGCANCASATTISVTVSPALTVASGSSGSSSNGGAIAGGVIGGILGLILIIAGCYYFIVVAKKEEESKWSVQSEDGKWHTYDADTCKVLEENLGDDNKKVEVQPTRPQECGIVTVDFDKMVELSEADNGTVRSRKVRRSEGDDEASPATTEKDLEGGLEMVGLEMEKASPAEETSPVEEVSPTGETSPVEEGSPAEEVSSATTKE